MSYLDYILTVLTQKAEDLQFCAATDDYLAESVRRWETCILLRVCPLFWTNSRINPIISEALSMYRQTCVHLT